MIDLSIEKKNEKKIYYLFVLVMIIAFGLRFFNLGQNALGETELQWSLQALGVSDGSELQIIGNAFYVYLTGLLFNVFQSTEFIARLMPAFLGTILVSLPFIFRKQLGHRAALLISFGLAIDPGLVSLSRQAGSDISGITLLFIAFIFFYFKKDIWAAVMFALSLLSGVSIIYGLIILGLAYFLKTIIRKEGFTKLNTDRIKKGFPYFVTTLVIVGTCFSMYPEGIASFGSGFQHLLEKFSSENGILIGATLLSFVIYQPLMFILGLIGAFNREIRGDSIVFLKWMLLVGSVLFLLFPGRQSVDLIWVVIPLYILAGLVLQRYVTRKSVSRDWVVISLTILVLAILIFGYFNLMNLQNINVPVGTNVLIDSLLNFQFSDWALSDASVQTYIFRWILLPLIPVLIAFVTMAATYIWSNSRSIQGVGWGVFIFLSILGMGLSVRIARQSSKALDVWQPDNSTAQPANLSEWIEWFGVINKGNKHELEVVVEEYSDQVAWQLRNFTNVEYGLGKAAILQPDIAITSELDFSLNDYGIYSLKTISIVNSHIDEDSQSFLWDDELTMFNKINLWVNKDLFPND